MKTFKICVDRKLCDGCGQCVNACPAGALFLVNPSRTCRN